MNVYFKKLHEKATIPNRATQLASGLDLHVLDVVQPENVADPLDSTFRYHILHPGERVLVRTGIALGMPAGMEAQIRPRSGIALKAGVTILNSPGTIDADFTGNLGAILINHGHKPFHIFQGDRVAQLVLAPVHHDVTITLVEDLHESNRGSGGFGHTGV